MPATPVRETLRMPAKVARALTKAAQEQDRSVNRQAIHYLKKGLTADGLLTGWPADDES